MLGRATRNELGTASIEYLVVLAAVSVGAALALATAGVALAQLHAFQRQLLLLPIP
jgi:hypothetical protein